MCKTGFTGFNLIMDMGPGFLESVYRNALAHELRNAGFAVELGRRISVRYEQTVVGEFVADMVVQGALICEPKAIRTLTKADEVQTVNYLTATESDFGLLLNFGARSLEFKRKFRRAQRDEAPPDLHLNPVNPV